ncbi:hypothetical protein R2Q26_12145 [Nitrosomonas sp. Is37]|nr:hypothetical protein [Nitrosomonas sp. Is37]
MTFSEYELNFPERSISFSDENTGQPTLLLQNDIDGDPLASVASSLRSWHSYRGLLLVHRADLKLKSLV